jgi:putative ABC transport system permease protein
MSERETQHERAQRGHDMRRVGRPRGIYIALGLLTLCAVFAATAGIREALVTTTQALRQTLAAAPSSAANIMVSGSGDSMSAALSAANPFGSQSGVLSDAQVTEVTGQLYADYNGYGHGAIKLAPSGDDWASLTSGLNQVQTPLPKVGGTPVKLEVTYRQPLGQYMRLVAGHFPAASAAAVPVPQAKSGNTRYSLPGALLYAPLMQVVVTQHTAATFGLRVGSKMQVPGSGALTSLTTVTLQVSGIVAPTDPNSSYWTADETPAVPELQGGGSFEPPPYWVGGVIAGPGEAAGLQEDFSGGLTVQWGLPLDLGSITAQQAQPLSNALTSITTQTPALTGDVEPIATTLSASADLLTTLAAYFVTAQSVDTLLWLLYVSLTVTGLAVLLLTARMVAMRRSGELAVIRARGASLWQVGLAAGSAAAVVCVPAAVIAAALAILAVHGPGSADFGSAGGWWPPVAILAVAICGPALIASWQHRLPRHRAASRHQPRRRVRLVTEVTLVAAAVAGIVVFRQEGTTPGSGVNLYTSAAPVLVAIPVVIVVLWIYPFALRGLLHASARSSGAPAFLGLARAARTTLTPALPAFALVLALTVAAFAGMVRDAVTNGDVAASWKAAGADVTISAQPTAPNFSVPPSALPAIGAVPGVTHEAEEWPANWLTSDGSQITVLAVDPASYAALVAATRGFPAVQAGLLSVPSAPGAAQPVLASPQAVADLGNSPTSISTLAAALRPVTVRVAGVVSATPGWPAGGAFLIMPLAALKSSAVPPTPAPVTELQLTGPNIDRTRLDAVLQHDLPAGWASIFRSDVLAELTSAPLQHGAFLLFTLSVALAGVLGLAVMFLELALGAAEREAALARLATMGLGERQQARVVALELLPAVTAAAAAAWTCALVLPEVVAPAINLSVFDNVPVPVPLAPDISSFAGAVPLVPDVASVALPLVGLVVLAAVSLGIEIRAGRRRGAAAALRIGG